MFENKIKILFKRRRANKSRYSANKIYVSRAELKHTNTKLFIILYIYNKQKSLIERNLRKWIKLTIYKKYLAEDDYKNDFNVVSKPIYKNRLAYIFKRFLHFRK